MTPQLPASQKPVSQELEETVRRLLVLLGEDPTREGLVKTPHRVAESLTFLTQGHSLSVETLHSALPFSSYEGVTVRGFPVTTISRGETIVENGAFTGAAGRGRFVERGY